VTHPPTQKFTKTDLAKFENTWQQLPHLVSMGAEKNFREFTLRRPDGNPDQGYFQQLVAKAILFRRAEKIISARRFGGYRANIVTYTLAYLCHHTAARLDLDHIWREQDISVALAHAIDVVSVVVQAGLVRPPGGRNVTEWCKRPECWEVVRRLRVELPSDLGPELLRTSLNGSVSGSTNDYNGLSEADRALVEQVASFSGEGWLRLSRWAKETNNLQAWQRSIAYGIGKRLSQGAAPSPKQAAQGVKMLAEAQELGFHGD
jgi:AIPR protein